MSKQQRECGARGAHAAITCLVAATAAGITACAPVTTLDGERLSVRSERFAEYVERVFREQNRVATELAFAFEDAAEPAELDALAAAEEALLEACAGLNEIAAARRDGDRLGRLRGLEAAREAPECERATARAAALLDG